MFCPGCGSEQAGQYCRSCGADLRSIRVVLEKPDASAATSSAREEIGRAVADKIREAKSWKDLSKMVEGVLPEIDKFLESPEEKRLRRIRRGTITAAIGLAGGLAFSIFGSLVNTEEFIFLGCLGFILFVIGLGVMMNGWHFTVAKTRNDEPWPEGLQKTLRTAPPQFTTPASTFPNSITDHTTHQLPETQLRVRQGNLE